MKTIEGQAAKYAGGFQQAMRLTSDINKREQEQKEVRDRLNYLQNESGAIGFVRLVTPALPAEMPMGVGKTKLLAAVLLLATVLALLAPVALDLVDRRIYTVNEAEKLLGIPAAGWQLEVSDRAAELYAREQTPALCLDADTQQGAFREIVFSFTSVKSLSTASNVIWMRPSRCNSWACACWWWMPTALPRVRCSMPREPACRTTCRARRILTRLVEPITHQELSLAGVGFGTQASTGIQRLDRLQQAMAHWREKFDFILINLPPILLSADAELLIDALGQVFMVLEAQSVNKGEITRAKRVLEKLDPEAVGLFVSNIPMFRGGGYMQELMVETLAKKSMNDFMSLSNLRLQFELLRARWVQKRMKPQEQPRE